MLKIAKSTRSRIVYIVVASGCALVAVSLIVTSAAVTYGTSKEAEDGAIAAPAAKANDVAAAGGQAVKFSPAMPTPTPTPTPPPTPPPGPSPRNCAAPVFQTSDRDGGWETNGHFVYNNVWYSGSGIGPQTLYACAFNNWYVTSNQTNTSDNPGAVKSYPNVHRDYNRPLSSFTTISSTYSHIAPTNAPNGIWNFAYDIWMNGLDIEVMIWTDNYRQTPAGNKVATRAFGGRNYDVWRTNDNHYMAFVAQPNQTSGTINIREMLDYLITQGWLSAGVELYQIGYGVEVVSTNGANSTFTFNDFSVTAN